MPKFRKKPVVVEAELYRIGLEDGFNVRPVNDERFAFDPAKRTYASAALFGWWVRGNGKTVLRPFINTLEGQQFISEGDYIITGVKGERYPCKPDIFEATYEPAESLDEVHKE